MKLTLSNNTETIVSESKSDVTKMLAYMSGQYTEERVHKPHKKHVFTKACFACGKQFKGDRGVSIHQAKCVKVKALQLPVDGYNNHQTN